MSVPSVWWRALAGEPPPPTVRAPGLLPLFPFARSGLRGAVDASLSTPHHQHIAHRLLALWLYRLGGRRRRQQRRRGGIRVRVRVRVWVWAVLQQGDVWGEHGSQLLRAGARRGRCERPQAKDAGVLFVVVWETETGQSQRSARRVAGQAQVQLHQLTQRNTK